MFYKLEIRSLATTEILDAFDWYENVQEGLVNEFMEELEDFFVSLQRNPNTYSYYIKPVRQGKISRFPFVVVYESFSEKEIVVVYSVFMTKQDSAKKRTS